MSQAESIQSDPGACIELDNGCGNGPYLLEGSQSLRQA